MTDQELLKQACHALTKTTNGLLSSNGCCVPSDDVYWFAVDVIQRLNERLKQAEQKPWGWAIVHSNGSVYRIRQKITNSWYPSVENEPFTVDDLEKADEEYKVCAPHTMITLYT